jgi:DNA-binding IclR family transcriptional regulator
MVLLCRSAILDAVESPRALRVASRTGSVLAANCTASGKALLAGLSDAEVTAIFADQETPSALTGRSITSCPRLLAELRTVRAQGRALNVEESEDGVASVAVTVRGASLAACGRGARRRRSRCPGRCPG